ncbi:MAG TPA: superoxide dismutase family protein [Burkholderiales bacterium]|jgi:Cu-Zn family superoxide dismutase|nr:superoxide dismutase family protein [Burkholderiales bacterium]
MRASHWLSIALCAVLAACGNMGNVFKRGPTATAVLAPTKGNQVSGTVQFRQKGEVVLVEAKVTGLKPNGTHGFHIHEKGDCSAPDASSAGAHFNPQGTPHGGPGSEKRHAGDLGNLQADANGFAQASIEIAGITLGTDANSIIGRSVIVHANPDDLSTQPAGNAGARIACGLISKNPDKFF